jgi:hypothetical protein
MNSRNDEQCDVVGSRWQIPAETKVLAIGAVEKLVSAREGTVTEKQKVEMAQVIDGLARQNAQWLELGRPDEQWPLTPKLVTWAHDVLERARRREEENRPRRDARRRYWLARRGIDPPRGQRRQQRRPGY